MTEITDVVVSIIESGDLGVYETLKCWREDEPEDYAKVVALTKQSTTQGLDLDKLAAEIIDSDPIQAYIADAVATCIATLFGGGMPSYDEADDDDDDNRQFRNA